VEPIADIEIDASGHSGLRQQALLATSNEHDAAQNCTPNMPTPQLEAVPAKNVLSLGEPSGKDSLQHLLES
jgi:hypothetical protein